MIDGSSLFQKAKSFDQDLSAWKLDSACVLESMFAGAESFDRDMNAWAKQLQGRTCVDDQGQAYAPKVTYMFEDTACPIQEQEPEYGSFCRGLSLEEVTEGEAIKN